MKKKPKRIGLAIIGAGRVGLIRAELAARHPTVGWIGIAEINPERGEIVREKCGGDFVTTDYKELLSRPEVNAVAVCTDEHLHVERLFDEPFVLAVPDVHPLAGRREVAMADLADQSLLLLEDGHCLRDQALDVCHLAGAGERSGFRATSLETLRQMVAANVGITLLPTLAVKPPVAAVEHIRMLPFKSKPPTRRIAMVWRRSSALHGFLSQLAQTLRVLPGGLLDPRATGAAPVPAGKPARARGKAA